MFYGYNLGDIRYVEYSLALDKCHLSSRDLILDVGCGHSILPTFLLYILNTTVIVIDINSQALKWQLIQANKLGKSLSAVLASANKLPFKSDTFSHVVSISTLEHLPSNMDVEAVIEISRVLKDDGKCLITVSASDQNTVIRNNLTTGMPLLFVKIIGPILLLVLRKLKLADRGYSYFERFYSLEDVLKRLVKSTNLKLEELLVIKRKLRFGKIVHQIRSIAVPFGVISAVELFCAKTLNVFQYHHGLNNIIAFALKLKKLQIVEKYESK